MLTALNRCQGRPASDGGMFQHLADEAILTAPANKDLLARLDAATDDSYPHRDTQIRQVALVVLRGRGAA